MALITMDFYSRTFGSNIAINVALPTPSSNEQIVDGEPQMKYRYADGLPVVYLLHGAYGDFSSWNRNSSIERYAMDRGIAVIMASAELSFYQDMAHGKQYKTFFTEELYHLMPQLFPLSKERSKTFIGGFSMGGYGACYLGFSRPDLYGKVATMSGALDIVDRYQESLAHPVENNPFNWEDCFGDPASLEGSDKDLFELYRRNKEAGIDQPLYVAVGRDDFLYETNVEAHKRFAGLGGVDGKDLIYVEGEGGHTWDFWDYHIRGILDWMLADVK